MVDSDFVIQERLNAQLGSKKGKGKKSSAHSAAQPQPGPSKTNKIIATTTAAPIVTNKPASVINIPAVSTPSISTNTRAVPTMKEKMDQALTDILEQSNSGQLSSDSITQALFKFNVLSAVSDGSSTNKRRKSVGFRFPWVLIKRSNNRLKQ